MTKHMQNQYKYFISLIETKQSNCQIMKFLQQILYDALLFLQN